MKKHGKSRNNDHESKIRPEEQYSFASYNHRVHDRDSDAVDPVYDAFDDYVDQYDLVVSERSFLEELDRKSRNYRLRSDKRRWSSDWDQDIDDWD